MAAWRLFNNQRRHASQEVAFLLQGSSHLREKTAVWVPAHIPVKMPASYVDPTQYRCMTSSCQVPQTEKQGAGITAAGRGRKVKCLVQTVLAQSDTKEEVYKALDECVAFETAFPVKSVRKALCRLKYREEWTKIIQVSKWMLSKGQGKTLATYDLMITAYNMLDRMEDIDMLWEKLIASNSRSLPKVMFAHMMHIYRRRGMLQKLIKVFEQMEAYGMNPDKDTLSLVGQAYESLGMPEKKERLTKKYMSPPKAKEKRKKSSIPSLRVRASNAVASAADCATLNMDGDVDKSTADNLIEDEFGGSKDVHETLSLNKYEDNDFTERASTKLAMDTHNTGHQVADDLAVSEESHDDCKDASGMMILDEHKEDNDKEKASIKLAKETVRTGITVDCEKRTSQSILIDSMGNNQGKTAVVSTIKPSKLSESVGFQGRSSSDGYQERREEEKAPEMPKRRPDITADYAESISCLKLIDSMGNNPGKTFVSTIKPMDYDRRSSDGYQERREEEKSPERLMRRPDISVDCAKSNLCSKLIERRGNNQVDFQGRRALDGYQEMREEKKAPERLAKRPEAHELLSARALIPPISGTHSDFDDDKFINYIIATM